MIWRTTLAALLLQLSALVAGQSELPGFAITAPAADNNCGGCYVVADVAGVAFGSQQLTAINTEVVSVGVGRNGTNSTTTLTITDGMAQFTFNPSGLVTAANGGFRSYGSGTVITVGGATLTSPTQYQVFSAYSVTSTVLSNGNCVAVNGERRTVNPAFSVEVPPGAGPNFAFDAQNSFISAQGLLPTCSNGGANISPTSVTVVNTLTSTSSTVGPLMTMSPQAVSTVAAATGTPVGFLPGLGAITSRLAEIRASESGAASASATTTEVSVGTIVVVGNGTFTPGISVYQPGTNAAPARPGAASTGLWAAASALAATLVACALL